MNRGFVKLWRKSQDSGWIKNHKLWVLWTWFLLRASYKESNAIIGLQMVHLKPGQFICGRKKCAKETGLSEQEVRSNMAFLKKAGNITIESTNKFSIITIMNWTTYQCVELDDQPVAPPASNQQLTTYKNTKNRKKKTPLFLNNANMPDWIPKEAFEEYLNSRKENKKPLRPESFPRFFSRLQKICEESHATAEEVLEQSILNGWIGIFPLKDRKAKTTTAKEAWEM